LSQSLNQYIVDYYTGREQAEDKLYEESIGIVICL